MLAQNYKHQYFIPIYLLAYIVRLYFLDAKTFPSCKALNDVTVSMYLHTHDYMFIIISFLPLNLVREKGVEREIMVHGSFLFHIFMCTYNE